MASEADVDQATEFVRKVTERLAGPQTVYVVQHARDCDNQTIDGVCSSIDAARDLLLCCVKEDNEDSDELGHAVSMINAGDVDVCVYGDRYWIEDWEIQT